MWCCRQAFKVPSFSPLRYRITLVHVGTWWKWGDWIISVHIFYEITCIWVILIFIQWVRFSIENVLNCFLFSSDIKQLSSYQRQILKSFSVLLFWKCMWSIPWIPELTQIVRATLTLHIPIRLFEIFLRENGKNRYSIFYSLHCRLFRVNDT